MGATARSSLSRRGEPAILPPDLGRLTLLRHACDVTVGIKLDPVSAFFDGRHALRVSSGCMSWRCDGSSPVLGSTHANVIVDFWGAPGIELPERCSSRSATCCPDRSQNCVALAVASILA